jgi:hypothetical protein
MLLPADLIAPHLGLLGMTPHTKLALAVSNKLQDPTLVGMALQRVRHMGCAILNGDWAEWASRSELPIETRGA